MTFKSGYDPRRHTQSSGIMQFHQKLAEMVRNECEAAMTFMKDTMNDPKIPTKLRLVAAKEILDRGAGRPIDCQVMLAIQAEDTLKDVGSMSDTELEALARSLTPGATVSADNKPVIVDGDFSEAK